MGRKHSDVWNETNRTKRCPRCTEWKDWDQFQVKSGRWYPQCRSCRTKNAAKYRKPRAHIAQENKKYLVERKGGQCEHCSYKSNFLSVYDFHHPPGVEKTISISKGLKQKLTEEVIAEADKCILLCSNCHRIHHEKERMTI